MTISLPTKTPMSDDHSSSSEWMSCFSVIFTLIPHFNRYSSTITTTQKARDGENCLTSLNLFTTKHFKSQSLTSPWACFSPFFIVCFCSFCFPVVISPSQDSKHLPFSCSICLYSFVTLFYYSFSSTHLIECLFCARYFPELQGYWGEQDSGITTEEYIGWQARQAHQQVITVIGAHQGCMQGVMWHHTCCCCC